MQRFAVVLIATLIAYVCTAHASDRSDRLKECQALADCLTILDAAIPEVDEGRQLGDEREIAENLRRFREAAKQELLRRAAGGHGGWRNLAGAVLQHWHDWLPSDVPALQAGLQSGEGRWLLRPLAEIATPEAIQVLADDLAQSPSAESRIGALKHLGAYALLPMLENEWQVDKANSVIRGLGSEIVLALAPDWSLLAAMPGQPMSARQAALRGIAAMGDSALPYAEPIHAVLADEDDFSEDAYITLLKIGDSKAGVVIAEKCSPWADEFAVKIDRCIDKVAAFGGNARAAGPFLMRFFEARNGAERAAAIRALGIIGYSEAIPAIVRSLDSTDWRIVLAAVRSLGLLSAVQAIPDLERVASSSWLPRVRDEAQEVLHVFKDDCHGKYCVSLADQYRMTVLHPLPHPSAPACPSGRWQWQGVPIQRPQPKTPPNGPVFPFPHHGILPGPQPPYHRLPLGGGTLTGSNWGMGSGELRWVKDGEQPQLLMKDGVIAIEPAEDGAIVLFGHSYSQDLGYGYAIHVNLRAGGVALAETAQLPGFPEAFSSIGPNLFAAWSDGMVIMFSSKEILGLAACLS